MLFGVTDYYVYTNSTTNGRLDMKENKDEVVIRNIRMPASLHQHLTAIAKDQRRSFNNLAVIFLEQQVKQVEKTKT